MRISIEDVFRENAIQRFQARASLRFVLVFVQVSGSGKS
jgi:hypothetical protein